MSNKSVFAQNLNRLMLEKGKSRRDVCAALGLSYYTYTDWCNGKKYPRMDKVEMLANYFGVLKSDLIEEWTEEREQVQQTNDTITDAVVRMRTDAEFLSAVECLLALDQDKLSLVTQMISAFKK